MLRVEVEYLFVLFHVHFGGLVGEYGEGRQILDGHGVFGTGRFGSCRARGEHGAVSISREYICLQSWYFAFSYWCEEQNSSKVGNKI